MKAKRCVSLALAAMLALALCAQAVPARADSAFTDVESGAWYEDYVERLNWLNIIDGYADGTFRPGGTLKRGEFLKMVTISAELYTATKPKGIHWAEEYWQMALEAEILYYDNTYTPLFSCTFDALEKSITRYEMAVLISNIVTKVYYEQRVILSSPEENILDYSAMSVDYQDAVSQAYGKGILDGFEDTSFRGGENLNRAQASAAIVRLLWNNERQMPEFATEQKRSDVSVVTTSFAVQYRTMSTEQRRIALFGSAGKTHFTSAADASGWMVTVTVPVWKLDSNGGKYASTASITVHYLVADEVNAIFHEIYNDPERFPIKSVGGARYTDSLRHSWGCAIDINPNENYYCRATSSGTTALTGSYWRPNEDPYSITPDGSVVRAFAKYGWGWGGQGWSGGYYDYMHFSILSNGG